MPHTRSSCKGRFVHFLRLELESLYRQRSAIDAEIKALQDAKPVSTPLFDASPSQNGLEIRRKPCNLTNCRSA